MKDLHLVEQARGVLDGEDKLEDDELSGIVEDLERMLENSEVVEVEHGFDMTVEGEEETKGCYQLNARQVLFLTFVGNAVFTIAQFVGSIISNSLALYGDSWDMGIDTITYSLNWYVEKAKAKGHHSTRALKTLEIRVSLLSALALILATVYLFYQGEGRLQHPSQQHEKPGWVILFASLNLVLDIMQIGMFVQQWWLTRGCSGIRRSMNVNLVSAAAHVAADTMRTLSEEVSAQLAVLGDFDPVVTDAWASFIVNIIVLLSGIILLITVVNKCRETKAVKYSQVNDLANCVELLSVQTQEEDETMGILHGGL